MKVCWAATVHLPRMWSLRVRHVDLFEASFFLFAPFVRAGSWQNGFFADFFFELPDFFADFLAGFFLLIFVGKSAQKNPPRKSPGKSSKIYITKIPDTFLQRGRANLCWPPNLFLSFSRHLFALFSRLKSALRLFCRAKGAAQSLERGSSRMDLSTKFGKEIPSQHFWTSGPPRAL